MTQLKLFQLLLAAMLGASATAQAADLLETYHAARANDPVFAAARAAQRAGQEKLAQGRSLLLPSVNLTANSKINDTTASRYNSHRYDVNLVQPLFRQQNWQDYIAAELQVAQSEAQFRNAGQELILRVARAYFDVLIAQDSVQLAEAEKTAIFEQLQQAKRTFEVGTATITDTHEAQARYDLVSAKAIFEQGNVEIKKSALQQLTNSKPGSLRPLGAQFKPELPQPAAMEKWVEQAQQRNPQLAVAQAAAELAEKEMMRNRGGHYPTLDLVASYSENFTILGLGGDSSAKVVGVEFKLPLFQGGATQSKWREAEANRDGARAELENARRNTAVKTSQAYLDVVTGIAQVQALRQALKSGESLLQASKLGQEVGVRTNLDVLNAQQQLYTTRRDLYQAQYNYLIGQLRLKAAAGTLVEEDLARVNQALY